MDLNMNDNDNRGKSALFQGIDATPNGYKGEPKDVAEQQMAIAEQKKTVARQEKVIEAAWESVMETEWDYSMDLAQTDSSKASFIDSATSDREDDAEPTKPNGGKPDPFNGEKQKKNPLRWFMSLKRRQRIVSLSLAILVVVLSGSLALNAVVSGRQEAARQKEQQEAELAAALAAAQTTQLSTAPTTAPVPTPTPTPVPTPMPTPTPTPTPIPTPTPEPDQLAGPFADGFILPEKGVRPFAAMIDNQGSRVLPQGGLDKAQLIYEIIVEGGISRFMVVFWPSAESEIPYVGPIRSARHYFLDYAMEHDALYLHVGQSPQALRDFSALKVEHIDGTREVFYDLTKSKNNWQDTFTSLPRLSAYMEKKGIRTTTEREPVLTYSREKVMLPDGEDAQTIRVTYSQSYYSGFIYQEETGLYQRFRSGKPHMARESEQNSSATQLTAKNILAIHVKNSSIDSADRQNLSDVGEGKGYYFTNGRVAEIRWSKSARTAATKFTYPDGEPVKLNPGQTYIQIIPSGGGITYEAQE